LDYCDKKDDELIFINQLYIIESYQLLGKYQQALEYAFMALQSCTDTSKFVAWHLQNIALTYNYMNKTDSMTFYFNKSLDLSIKNKDTACISFCYEHLGLSCSNRGLLNEAKNFYEKALEIDSASGDILKCAYDYYRLGENVTQKDSLTTNDFYTAKYYFIKALNIFDFEAMELRYAIANQNAYIVRNGEKILLKGDAMPVGRYYAEKEHFQTLSTPLQHGDTVYMFSDGIQDQFGGEAGNERKFMRKNLINLLASNFTLPMSEQMSKLNEAITAWRGNRAQIDDMTLVGIRVA